MSNKKNHRVTPNKRNGRKDEIPDRHGCCGGAGHNGVIGRTAWKKLSRRCERRSLKTERVPRIQKTSNKGKYLSSPSRRRIMTKPMVTENEDLKDYAR
jgi:hypothetical protein